ncbi:MAG: hypothetical protein CSB24_04865 [Deltaproteobacteria bacterium]|nr:MAG: hypothetical protein CSB24_04865 [Deltaproteobacteria bacterium]
MSNSEGKDSGFIGTLSVQLPDILQMSCIGGTTAAIVVSKGSRNGKVYLVEGEIVHAEVGDVVGEDAFYTIMGWNQGSFEFRMGEKPDKKTITLNWQHLIMEACRKQDEGETAAGSGDAAQETGLKERDRRIRVLVVDDSSMMRKALASIFGEEEFIIVGNAADGEEALELIPKVHPDVITMDINMPVMDGVAALKRIMIRFPIPTVMVSAMTHEGATITFDTLKYGAVDFIPKPSSLSGEDKEKQKQLIRKKVQLAADVSINSVRYIRTEKLDQQGDEGGRPMDFAVCMVAAEGGYGTLLKVIPQIPAGLGAAFMVVLYADPEHVDAFVSYIGSHSQIPVKRATDGMPLEGGVCYLVSGLEYAKIEKGGDGYSLHLTPSSFPDRRGAGDMLMISMAEVMGADCMGVVLSGASTDGTDGMNELQHSRAGLLIQQPETCLVKEMAESALEKCPDALVAPDSSLGSELVRIIVERAEAKMVSDPA